MSRPEHICPPEIFYNEKEAAKYDANSRMSHIQASLANRAIELLALEPSSSKLILDVGCGSGLSGAALTDSGHSWIGTDISPSMLHIACKENDDNNVAESDMGQGLPFRQNLFDGCISISAVQWLCYSDKKSHVARNRLMAFFKSLYACLKTGSRAVLQLYPETPEQMELISNCAMKCGFSGGLVVDFPNSTKAKKYFLTLFAGGSYSTLPAGAASEQQEQQEHHGVSYASSRQNNMRKRRGRLSKRMSFKSKDWILEKKAKQRAKGQQVKKDSKFTGRRRRGAF